MSDWWDFGPVNWIAQYRGWSDECICQQAWLLPCVYPCPDWIAVVWGLGSSGMKSNCSILLLAPLFSACFFFFFNEHHYLHAIIRILIPSNSFYIHSHFIVHLLIFICLFFHSWFGACQCSLEWLNFTVCYNQLQSWNGLFIYKWSSFTNPFLLA